MKVSVDRKKCCGYAMCVETCPEVYQLDDAGYSYVVVDVVPSGLVERARRAAASCPERAIVIDKSQEDTG